MEKKVFSPEEEAAEKITTTMASAHAGVRSPDVHDDPQYSTVARAGQAASAEARQQARGMAGTLHEVRQGKRVRLPHPEHQGAGRVFPHPPGRSACDDCAALLWEC